MSDFLEAAILDHRLGTPYTADDPLYIAAFTVAPTDAGGGTEVAGGAYARVAVALANLSRSGSTISNDNIEEFPEATADWGTVVALGTYDASTAGNLLDWDYAIAQGASWVVGSAQASDTIVAPAHGFSDDDQVVISAIEGYSLPTGVTEGQQVYVISSTTDTLQLSATQGGAAIDITVAGTLRMALSGQKAIGSGDLLRIKAGAFQIILT